jgi:hypothetical protein
MQTEKRQCGGKRDGAGRPALPPELKARKVEVWLPPDIYAAIVLSAGSNERGAIPHEIVRILRNHLVSTSD